MGVNIAELFPKQEISLDDLKGKIVAIDFMNVAYQFLASIRQRDGSLLTDSSGNITSHLQGLFNRSVSLLEKGIKLVYVFDGGAPSLKAKERELRMERKKKAQEKYDLAVFEEDVDSMYKYSQQMMFLSDDMILECKELLDALGIPYVQAPSEAEAQAAYMCNNNDVYAVASQDADALLFGAPKLIRNLTLAGSRKTAGGVKKITPELIELKDVLDSTGLRREKLIVLSILVGTDFNPKGVKGYGPKKALKAVKDCGDFGKLFDSLECDFDWKEVYNVFDKIPVEKKYTLEFGTADAAKLKELLVEKHEFSENRVDSVLKKLSNVKKEGQKSLGEF